jgi:D-arabinose 1-dehydrogenase-like Zn-dependent alcohol dehydrogenase
MRAMKLDASACLHLVEIPNPKPQQVLIKVSACGVCRTELNVVARALDELAGIRIEIERLALTSANDALARLRRGDVRGAFMLKL